jgi:dephospho-CoA kinase
MLVVGLTGGVGVGKSVVAEFLAARGEPVIDTDVIAREVVATGSEALREIKVRFGAGMIKASGQLDREALAREVFEREDRRRILESIVHPRIRARWREVVEQWRTEGKRRAVVVIPLLFETGAQAEVGRAVCVACSPRVQMTRLRGRNWTDEEARRRIAAQWPAERKMDLADAVIWNESNLEVCQLQASRVFAREDVA